MVWRSRCIKQLLHLRQMILYFFDLKLWFMRTVWLWKIVIAHYVNFTRRIWILFDNSGFEFLLSLWSWVWNVYLQNMWLCVLVFLIIRLNLTSSEFYFDRIINFREILSFSCFWLRRTFIWIFAHLFNLKLQNFHIILHFWCQMLLIPVFLENLIESFLKAIHSLQELWVLILELSNIVLLLVYKISKINCDFGSRRISEWLAGSKVWLAVIALCELRLNLDAEMFLLREVLKSMVRVV